VRELVLVDAAKGAQEIAQARPQNQDHLDIGVATAAPDEAREGIENAPTRGGTIVETPGAGAGLAVFVPDATSVPLDTSNLRLQNRYRWRIHLW
jgi:hypothetical protein